MSDTNSLGGVVRILETPKQQILSDNILVTRFRVQFPQVRNNSILHLTCWGNLARDVANYYKTNDYVLLEGYVSLKDNKTTSLSTRALKKIEVTVLKIYPFLLSYERPSNTNSNH